MITKLVGGFNHLETYEFVNGKDDIPYIMENKIHVPNHQPESLCSVKMKNQNASEIKSPSSQRFPSKIIKW
jgi:hypothetical protein